MATISDFIESLRSGLLNAGAGYQQKINDFANYESNQSPIGSVLKGDFSKAGQQIGQNNFFQNLQKAGHGDRNAAINSAMVFGGTDTVNPNGSFVDALANQQPKINVNGVNAPVPPDQQGPMFPDKPLNETVDEGAGGTPKSSPYQYSQEYSGEPSHTFSPTLPTEADRLRGITPDGKIIQTPDEARQINATLNGYGINGSLTDQLQATTNKIGNLGNQAKSIVTQQGGTLSKADLINLSAENIVKTPGVDIPPSQAINEATRYVNQVYGKVVGVHPNDLEGFIAPDQISGNIAQDMKTLMNQENASTFVTDPTKWTSGQVISRPAGDSLDRILDTTYPDASKLNNDMSDLYKAKGSLLKGSAAEIKTAQSAPPPIGMFGKISNTVGNIAKNPIAQMLGVGEILRGGSDIGNIGKMGTLAAEELSQIPNQIADKFGYTPKTQQPQSPLNNIGNTQNSDKNNSTHTYSIAPGVNSHMAVPDIKSTTGIPVTADEYQKQILNPAFAPGSNARVNLDTQYALTKQIADQNMPGNIKYFMGGASQALMRETSLKGEDINNLSKLYSKLGNIKDYQAYVSNPANPFATELQKLSSVNNYYKQAYSDVTGSAPDSNYVINPGDSSEQIKEKLDYQTSWINDSYKKYQPYWDAVNPTASPSTTSEDVGNQTQNTSNVYTQNTGSLPATPPAFPAGFKMTQ